MATPPAPHNSLNLFFFKYYKNDRMNQQPVFVMAPRRSGGGGLALLLMMLLLLFVIVVTIVAIVIIRRRKMNSEKKNTRSKIRDHRNNLYEGAEGVGINKEDVDEIILDKSNRLCLVYPNEDGVCDTRFYDLTEGCCKLKSNAEEVSGLQQQEMMNDVLMEVGVLLIAEVVITDVLPRLGSRIAKYSSKALAKITARTAQAMAAKLALKMTQFASRILIKLGSGPVGWALLVFEMISLTMDLADLRNYDSFIENKTNMEMRDLMVYKFYEAITLSGSEYPVLFPYSVMFPEVSETVSSEMTSQMMTDYMDELLEIDGGMEYMTNLLLKAFDAEDEGTNVISETPDEQMDGLGVIDTWLSNVRKKHAVELDKKLSMRYRINFHHPGRMISFWYLLCPQSRLLGFPSLKMPRGDGTKKRRRNGSHISIHFSHRTHPRLTGYLHLPLCIRIAI